MSQNQLKYYSFKNVTQHLKTKIIDNNYLQAEKEIIKKCVQKTKKEIELITMTDEKLHKAFSL
jgi:hypothetical protein